MLYPNPMIVFIHISQLNTTNMFDFDWSAPSLMNPYYIILPSTPKHSLENPDPMHDPSSKSITYAVTKSCAPPWSRVWPIPRRLPLTFWALLLWKRKLSVSETPRHAPLYYLTFCFIFSRVPFVVIFLRFFFCILYFVCLSTVWGFNAPTLERFGITNTKCSATQYTFHTIYTLPQNLIYLSRQNEV